MPTAIVRNTARPLYRHVLGTAWNDLAPGTRHAHEVRTRLDSFGRFDITRGDGAFVGLLARCARLPQTGNAVPARLTIIQCGDREECSHWPMRMMILCLTNDLIWWIPFALYLYDVWADRTDAAMPE